MIQLIRIIWYLVILILIVYILRQQPKLQGINSFNKREKGVSVSSRKERILMSQTWILTLIFIALTVSLTKFSEMSHL